MLVGHQAMPNLTEGLKYFHLCKFLRGSVFAVFNIYQSRDRMEAKYQLRTHLEWMGAVTCVQEAVLCRIAGKRKSVHIAIANSDLLTL